MNKYPWLDGYLLKKAGAVKEFKEEWQWWRYLVGGKQFAATLKKADRTAILEMGSAGHE